MTVYKSVMRGPNNFGDHTGRILQWGFGMSSSQRSNVLVRSCIPLFARVSLNHHDYIIRRNVLNRHIWLVVSGECIGTLPSSSYIVRPGEWIGLDSVHAPENMEVQVSSNQATFLRISVRDFNDRLPREITQNMSRRIRGQANLDKFAFRKAIRISESIMPELRDPVGVPKSARLVPIREMNKYADGKNIQSDCERERIKLHELSLTAR